MLTRLKVSGFKNLIDVDITFGPLTCIAGANGVGKSNLFDAIKFLATLAEGQPIIQAASTVRSEGGNLQHIRDLFPHIGQEVQSDMSFDAYMIIPQEGVDDLGQQAQASSSFLHYSLKLRYRDHPKNREEDRIEIIHESLEHIRKSEAKQHLKFKTSRSWQESSLISQRRQAPFISTQIDKDDHKAYIRIHQDSGSGGKRRKGTGSRRLFLAETLPKTVLSHTSAAEGRTALLARREMQSWRLLQLEPSALRKPDSISFMANQKLSSNGSGLAATLYKLIREEGDIDNLGSSEVCADIANTVSKLIGDVREVSIDRDDKRNLLRLYILDKSGTKHYASSLSDGTLRFLALAVIDQDIHEQGLICLEEPENGIHPTRVGSILELLQQISTNPDEPTSTINPLRQLIINTHSPLVVKTLKQEDLVFASLENARSSRKEMFKRTVFKGLSNTWRTEPGHGCMSSVELGIVIDYLTTPSVRESDPESTTSDPEKSVLERDDIKQLLLF